MSKSKPDLFGTALSASRSAPLQTNDVATSASKASNIERKSKNVMLPVAYFETHAGLRTSGKTNLNFTAYILEAVREKLEREA